MSLLDKIRNSSLSQYDKNFIIAAVNKLVNDGTNEQEALTKVLTDLKEVFEKSLVDVYKQIGYEN